jgi:hypothetical protein
VKGMEKIDIAISETDKFTRNLHNSEDIRSPFNNTMIVIKLLPSDTKAVIEYNEIMMTCQGHNSNASSGGSFALMLEFKLEFWDTLLTYTIGSIF